ncbi:MAG: UDP-3-O-[3-hydroxymyristoyl] N-acetylglucosamine deacetylase [SAR324 cluster bacterium]|nr:UDP-3-O-[3-hydroxymyristoyl] N-acetylglucosamine deacetylase [SAR324 cluster bacterium]MBL7035544.1 UDP-3-O-[3-hydroxymyristoyl] N-acetylglucosamine deacetylase [SAR324 cluster bacterium]
MTNSQIICVVDDEPAIRETLERVLGDEGYPVVSCQNSEEFCAELEQQIPALVLLDIWLPGTDGMAILSQLRETHPELPVIMMSGHAGIDAAVNAIKLGAVDFMEKPLRLEILLDKIAVVLSNKPPEKIKDLASDTQMEVAKIINPIIPSGALKLEDSNRPQRTLKSNVVLNGKGLLTGRNTGVILSPLEANSGIVFQTLDDTSVPAHITNIENFSQSVAKQSFSANSTVLARESRRVRTVEHLMASLHMAGITNVLAKVDEEIPNIDGSANDFSKLINDAGILDQDVAAKDAVVLEPIQVGRKKLDEKHLYVEPFDGFEVKMRVDYDAPIGEQKLTFNAEKDSFDVDIAPARSFNTFENIDMAQKSGTVGSGYLDSHIIMHDGKVINTDLRYPDEFVRHKILDLIGDLFLLGYPLRGRVVANMTSHGYNQALVQKLHVALTT